MDCIVHGVTKSRTQLRLSLTHSSRLPLSHVQTVTSPCPQPEDTTSCGPERVHSNIVDSYPQEDAWEGMLELMARKARRVIKHNFKMLSP